ncbi:MAG TPA: hypothetical protein PKX91_03590 [Clostridia bacterium]|nr:hypothetical protein [Clostridia bacterium]
MQVFYKRCDFYSYSVLIKREYFKGKYADLDDEEYNKVMKEEWNLEKDRNYFKALQSFLVSLTYGMEPEYD